mmetsp:Transcript_82/g.232  ORF Transcript_82/g.232 Transcript_82/m.232 type:complete len:144 (-) Transcript_82:141-572(-)
MLQSGWCCCSPDKNTGMKEPKQDELFTNASSFGKSPDPARSPTINRVGGVGLVFETDSINRGLKIADMKMNGPAMKSGVNMKGMTLVAIDGHPVVNCTIEQIASKLLGPPGSQVKLLLRPPVSNKYVPPVELLLVREAFTVTE